MHYKRVIPCMDVDAGRVVKGTRFLDIRDAGDPVELAAFYDAEGADELVFLDITATSDKRDTVVELARRAADEVFIPFTIGGGIRSAGDAQAVLDAGADKVVGQLGRGRAAGADRRARQRVRRPVRRARDRRQARRGTAGRSTSPAAAPPTGHRRRLVGLRGRLARRGGDPADLDGPRRHQGRLRHRPRARDRRRGRGARSSPPAARASPSTWSTRFEAGADAVLLASILHYGRYSVAELKQHLAAAGVPVRALSAVSA